MKQSSKKLSYAMRRDSGKRPPDGTVGREKPDWCSVGFLPVTTGGIDIADAGAPGPGNGLRVKLPAGNYAVEAKLIDFGGSLLISRLRFRPEGMMPTIGRLLSEVSVDMAAIVIVDHQALELFLDDYQLDDFNERVNDARKGIAGIANLKFGRRTIPLALCRSGFGDGSFSIFSLRSGRVGVGFEIEFMKDGRVI